MNNSIFSSRSQTTLHCVALIFFLALAVMPAQAGQWVLSGQYAFKSPDTNTSGPIRSDYNGQLYTAGATQHDGQVHGEAYTATSTLTITHLIATWQPANNEPAPTVLVAKITADADSQEGVYHSAGTPQPMTSYSGSADNALHDNAIPSPGPGMSTTQFYVQSYGSHYAIKDNTAQNLTVPLDDYTVTTTVSGQPAAQDTLSAQSNLTFQMNTFPVTIEVDGTTPYQGQDDVLVGQQITASIQNLPPLSTTYAWKFNYGSNFADYRTYNSNNDQLVNLTAPDDYNKSKFNFYTKKDEMVEIQCTLTFHSPDPAPNGSDITVKVQRDIKSMKPKVTKWTITPGYVQYSPTNMGTGIAAFGYFGDSSKGNTYGMGWSNVTLSFLPPFSNQSYLGRGTFTQLILPDRKDYNGSIASSSPNNGLIGLDHQFIYGDGAWNVPNSSTDGDSPAIAQNSTSNSNGYSKRTANDTFTTWVMYNPPSVVVINSNQGTVWVPLQKYSWTWSEEISWMVNQWTITASYPATAGAAPIYTPQNTSEPPQWNIIQ